MREARPPVEDLQVGDLEDVLGGATIPFAASQRPAEGGGVKTSELGVEIEEEQRRRVHLGICCGIPVSV